MRYTNPRLLYFTLLYFRDKPRYWSQIVIFLYSLAFNAPVRGVPVGILPSRLVWKNHNGGATRWWKNFVDMCKRLHTIPACDGRTDILPRHSPRYAYASRGKNPPGAHASDDCTTSVCMHITMRILNITLSYVFVSCDNEWLQCYLNEFRVVVYCSLFLFFIFFYLSVRICLSLTPHINK